MTPTGRFDSELLTVHLHQVHFKSSSNLNDGPQYAYRRMMKNMKGKRNGRVSPIEVQ